MKSDTIEILSCPVCQKSPLQMKVFSHRNEEIIKAELLCSHCGGNYPVRDGIPVMLFDLDSQKSSHFDNLKDKKIIDENLYKKHKEVREANIIYYDSVAEVYENEVEQAVHQSDFNQRRMDEIVKGLAEKTQKDLFLDLGCGTGNLLKFGKKHFKKAIGIDISFKMLKVAKQNNLEVIQADILFLPFKPSIFDVVSIFSVLHHLYDYQQIFNQISRVLKRGGYLYSDWDPTKKPLPDYKRTSWRIYQLVDNLFSLLRPVKQKIEFITRKDNHQKAPIDFLKMRPDLKEIHVKAEFHEKKKEVERGIVFDKLKRSLMENGFIDIQPTFHWAGKSINQLSLPLRTKFFFLRFQGYPVERFMENIMVITQKK